MSDDARRPLTEEERARVHAARYSGDLCARCGRRLAADEPVWVVRFDVYGDGRAYWRAPVGRECAPPAVVAAAEAREPAACVACGRGVFYERAHPLRRLAACSKRCQVRVSTARGKEAKGS